MESCMLRMQAKNHLIYTVFAKEAKLAYLDWTAGHVLCKHTSHQASPLSLSLTHTHTADTHTNIIYPAIVWLNL